MGRVKLAASAEAAPGGDWDALTNTEKTRLVRMFPAAIFGSSARDMQDALRQQNPGEPDFDSLTGPELAELTRIRVSMRDTYDRQVGVGVTVIGAPGLLD